MKKVTIIAPAYNHERYIAQCIESALAQTYKNWEMIIVDDGSDDKTGEIAKRYKDPRIRYHCLPHRGIMKLGETYNYALDRAEGEILAILECDDYWPRDKLETLVPFFEDEKVVMAYGFARLVSADGKEKELTIPSNHLVKNFPTSVFFNDPVGTAACFMARSDVRTYTFPCALMMRTAAVRKMSGFKSVPGLPFIDYPTFINLSLEGKYFFVPRVMGYWRQHINSNTQTRDDEKTNELLRDYALKFIDDHASLLPLAPFERKAIAQTWEHIDEEGAFSSARKLLLMKRWREARAKFKKILLKEKRVKRWTIALFGYSASWLHRDIEQIYSLTGRATMKDLLPRTKEK